MRDTEHRGRARLLSESRVKHVALEGAENLQKRISESAQRQKMGVKEIISNDSIESDSEF